MISKLLEEIRKNPEKYRLSKEDRDSLYESHARNVLPALEENARERARSFYVVFRGKCPPFYSSYSLNAKSL